MQSYLVVFHLLGEHSERSLENHPKIADKMAASHAVKLSSTTFFINSKLSSGNLLVEYTDLIQSGEDIYVFRVDRTDWNAYTGPDMVNMINDSVEESELNVLDE